MIPKIICFLFGHIRRENIFVGLKELGGTEPPIRLFNWEYCDACPRCGKELKKDVPEK